MYTKHSLHQMSQRGITKNQVAKALANGVQMVNKWDSNKLTIIDNSQGLYVVTNHDATIVITVFWRTK